MTSVTGSDLGGSTQLTRRLSILPALLGLASVIVVGATGFLAGVAPAGGPGPTLVLVGAAAVGATIVSGHPVGLYVGITLVVSAALVDDESLSARSLMIISIGLLLAHELARLALDARRPARFGSGVWLRYGLRTVGLASLLAAAAWLEASVETLTIPDAMIPVGIAVAALPLLARRAVTGPAAVTGKPRSLGPRYLRTVVGSVVAVVAIAGAILGAGARAGLIDDRGGPSGPVASPATAPTTTPPPFDDTALIDAGVSIVLFVIALVLAFLFVALRRREMTFELDELDMESDDTLLDLAGPGQADLEDIQVEIDEGTMRRLLDELALDLAAELDPGRAIRFAYANVEQRLAALDVVRAETETEQEFLRRTLPSLGTDSRAMVTLTGLFEQARFGHTPISEAMRSKALDAVQVLRAATTTSEPIVGSDRADPGGMPTAEGTQ